MKILKIILSIILVIVIIIVAGSFFLPKKSNIERSIMIDVSDSVAYSYIIDFSKFNDWSPWYEMEPTAKTEVKGRIGQVGSVYSWVGKKVGVGSFEIIKLEPYTAVYQKLTFKEPFLAIAENNFMFNQQSDSTKVTWIYEGNNDGIMAKWMGLAMEGMMGKDFERGLIKMKTNLEE